MCSGKSNNEGSDCCRRPWSKARCFYGSITSCGYFCLVADATTAFHAIKVVVATTATGGRIDPLLTEKHQCEMGILWSPHLASEESMKRGPKVAPESIQSRRGSSFPIPQSLVMGRITRNCSCQGQIEVGYLRSGGDQKTHSFLYDVITENRY